MKLLVDMNLSPRWIQFLGEAGWPAVHWSSVGLPNAPDVEITTYAAANGFTVLTNDLDFAAILALSNEKKPSVIQIRAVDLSPGAIGRDVVNALQSAEKELIAGAILTIEPDRTRVRILPLKLEP